MILQSQREMDATCEKLRMLQERYEMIQRQPMADQHVRELTLRSLKRMINQLQEEIVRFEGRASVRMTNAQESQPTLFRGGTNPSCTS